MSRYVGKRESQRAPWWWPLSTRPGRVDAALVAFAALCLVVLAVVVARG